MKTVKNPYFFASLFLLLMWELLMIFIQPENGSFLKVIITSLLWISIISNLINIYVNFNFILIIFPKKEFYVLLLLLLWNIINIVRSIVNVDSTLLTAFGNPYTILSLLIPFVFFFGANINNIILFRKYLIKAIKISIIILPVYFLNSYYLAAIVVLCLGYIFLFPSFIIENKNTNIIILFSVLATLFLSPNSRSTFLRMTLFLIPFILLLLQKKINFPFSFKHTLVILIIPFYFVFVGYSHGNSIFRNLAENKDDELFIDTRTFLFEEVIEDLTKNDKLFIGKGATSNYYSNYFSNIVQVKNNRLTVEVGVLTILLKGGIIAVFLNLFAFIYAVYLGYFKSKNVYSKILGYIILVHIVLLFAENLVAYNFYNFIIWFTTGILYNKKFRFLTNNEIQKIIY